MRSSDVAVGLIYDTLSFKMLHNAISAELSILTGEFEMILLNAHIYEPQIPVIKQIAQAGFGYRQIGQELLPIHLPDCAWSISNIVADPDGFVEYVNQYDYLVKDLPKFDMFVAV